MNWYFKSVLALTGVMTVLGAGIGLLAWRHISTINKLYSQGWEYLNKIHDQLLSDGYYHHSHWQRRKSLLWQEAAAGIEEILAAYPASIKDHVREHLRYDSRRIVNCDTH
ncbi:hypothetical protein AVT69_gp108 [Pseudomonas phage PhiPA3]|uniref:Uncharacterized protein 109 n=1 Tax=Pseudomonas phage PhiPA3 TaxID=998086 RepID=F8SJY5_BPPA3|nr:hypothetical protein AVT69_gp108 [Pseudomonas phage PhiPA3]AEH03533.1 hypothetical protein [Pseudomonas phage PhiPA3]